MRADHPRIRNHLLPGLTATCLGAACLAVGGNASAFEVSPEGRLHLDYAAHHADVKPLKDDLVVRRAVFGLDGKFNDDWSFEIAYEFANDGEIRSQGGKFRDVAVEYDGWQAADLTLGQFKLPFGLEELGSSNNTSFVERALPLDAFAPSRRMGIGFNRNRNGYTLAAMGFASSIDGGDRGHGAAARLTIAPVDSGSTVLHLGIAAVTEHPRGEVKFNARPESRVADVKFVNTGDIDDVTRIDRIGLEAAWKSGPVSAQAEWMRAVVGRDAGHSDASLEGWYVAGSWIITGETRRYKNGAFKDITPSRSSGAWELTARYSHLDLDDGQIRGGKQDNFTFGLNYYASKHLRIMANYIKVRSERRGKSDNPGLLLVRAQLAF